MAIVRIWHSGDNSNPRDGDWATAAYCMSGAFSHNTQPIQDDDVVLIASDHYYLYNANFAKTMPERIYVTSVNRTTEKFELGAFEGYSVNNKYMYFSCGFCQPFVVDGLEWVANTGNIGYFPGIYQMTNCFYKNCKIYFPGTNGIYMGASGYQALAKFEKCILDFNNNANKLIYFPNNTIEPIFINCEFINTDAVQYLYDCNNYTNTRCKIYFEDCDLSNINFLIRDPTAYDIVMDIVFNKCKLHPSFNLEDNHNLGIGETVVLESCSTTGVTDTPLGINIGKTYYGIFKFDTTVYRNATDAENSYSIKLASNANAKVLSPLKTTKSLSMWHKANNLTKLYVYFVANDSNLTDRDVWIEVRYNSHTSSPVGTFLCTLPNYNEEKAANSSPYLKSAYLSQWVGSGFNTAYRFEITGIQPQEPGPISVDFFLGKASTTVWVCPHMELS